MRNFRTQKRAAPLKRRPQYARDTPGIADFRTQKRAAPLKLGALPKPRTLIPDFRTQKRAAPLKPSENRYHN